MLYTFLPSDQGDSDHLSFWQSHTWERILEYSGQSRESFYFGNPKGTYFLVELRVVKFGMIGAFILGVKNCQIGHDATDCLDALKYELKKKNIVFLQFEPIEEIPFFEELSQKMGNTVIYKNFLPPFDRLIDLHEGKDEIFAAMKEKGRYHINLAIKRGVEIRAVSPTKENIDIWMGLLEDTRTRDEFSTNSRKYYEIFLQEVSRQYGDSLYFGYVGDRVVVAGIFVFTPERTIYYYGASSSNAEDRKKMGSYLLQWHIIQEAKERNSKYYDFLGVADPNNPNDPLKGVSNFKEKFGGERITLPKKIMIPLCIRGKILLFLKSLIPQ